jgi:hypothetical protein
MAVFWFVSIALMMEAASTSETSVNSYQTTRRSNPEDSHFRIQLVPVSDFYENGNGMSGCITDWEFLYQMSDYQIFKESGPWSLLLK